MTFDEIAAELRPKTALIVRGIPGSGKSTLIERLNAVKPLQRVAFDDYRGSGENYKYDAKDQPRVNNKTGLKFRELLKGNGIVAVEGVFGSHDKIQQYRQWAKARGFRPVVVTVSAPVDVAAERGIHGVDADKTAGMAESIAKSLPADWEHFEVSEEGEVAPLEPTPGTDESGMVDTLAPSETTELPATQPNWDLAGECLLAVTTPWPGGPIMPEHGAEAEEIFSRLEEMAAEFCKFEAFQPWEMPPAIADFKVGYAACTTMSPEEYELYTQELASPELIMSWTLANERARAYLRFIWPVSVRETPTGPEWNDPNTTDRSKTAACLAIVKRPESLFQEMLSGSASPEMFAAVKEVFPQLHGRMKAIMETQLKLAGAEGRTCPWAQEYQLRQLFETPPTELITVGNDDSQGEPQNSGEFKIKFDELRTRGQSVH